MKLTQSSSTNSSARDDYFHFPLLSRAHDYELLYDNLFKLLYVSTNIFHCAALSHSACLQRKYLFSLFNFSLHLIASRFVVGLLSSFEDLEQFFSAARNSLVSGAKGRERREVEKMASTWNWFMARSCRISSWKFTIECDAINLAQVVIYGGRMGGEYYVETIFSLFKYLIFAFASHTHEFQIEFLHGNPLLTLFFWAIFPSWQSQNIFVVSCCLLLLLKDCKVIFVTFSRFFFFFASTAVSLLL
jgi:hypothetical protein